MTPPASPATPAPSAAHDPRPYVQIAADLRAKIHDGTLTAGTALPINDLARQWEVCRNTARKALRALQDEGLIRSYPWYGYRVLPAASNTPATEATPADDTPQPADSQ
jgi:DNA-binding GntR family transcriptional regulator